MTIKGLVHDWIYQLHLGAPRQNSVRLSQKQRGSMKFLATGQQRASRVISQSSNMAGKGHTQMRSTLERVTDRL